MFADTSLMSNTKMQRGAVVAGYTARSKFISFTSSAPRDGSDFGNSLDDSFEFCLIKNVIFVLFLFYI